MIQLLKTTQGSYIQKNKNIIDLKIINYQNSCSGVNFESWYYGAKNFSCNLYGRYVGIKLYGHTGPLTLCEVKVTPGYMLSVQDFGGYFGKSLYYFFFKLINMKKKK